jgi:hypothetical protein
MVERGEITEAQREDVFLEDVIVRPVHERDSSGGIIGVIGCEVVPREELLQEMQRETA